MIKVEATAKGHFGVIRNEGDVFEIENMKQKGSWMKVVSDSNQTPPDQTPPVTDVNGGGQTLADVNQAAIDAQSGPDFLS